MQISGVDPEAARSHLNATTAGPKPQQSGTRTVDKSIDQRSTNGSPRKVVFQTSGCITKSLASYRRRSCAKRPLAQDQKGRSELGPHVAWLDAKQLARPTS